MNNANIECDIIGFSDLTSFTKILNIVMQICKHVYQLYIHLAIRGSALIDISLLSLAFYDSSKNLKECFGYIDPRYFTKIHVDLMYEKYGGAQVYKVFDMCEGAPDSEIEKLLTEVFQYPVVKHLRKLSFLL